VIAGAGSRLPHAWLPDGRSLYDVLGPGLTLLARSGDETSRLRGICAQRGVPLTVVTIHDDDTGRHRLPGSSAPTNTSPGPAPSCRATRPPWWTV
jgi:hypothetical protein